jgi:lipopolysaccharide export LptBFGC system permease protein LptF
MNPIERIAELERERDQRRAKVDKYQKWAKWIMVFTFVCWVLTFVLGTARAFKWL